MSENLDNQPSWTRDELIAREAVRTSRPPAAREEFRAILRERFVRGELDRGGIPASRPRPAHGPNAVPLHRVRPWARYAVPVAVAAALVLMVGVFNRGPHWQVERAEGSFVVLDGQRLSCAELSPIQAALHPGCEVSVPDGSQMELVSAGQLMLQLNGGVSLSVPSPPGRWFGRDVTSEVGGTGTLRIVTAPGFEGARYRLRAAGSELIANGTAFTVMRGGGEICVCVLEGEVSVLLASGAREVIAAGRRLTFSEDAQRVDRGEMLATERDALQDLRTRTARTSASS